ncbi:chemotaxis protein CheW [Natronospirillum operosum]|uniref:Chemotaxis protein CheW n=2 Tax=Natronospirillum operosum TaxID=2759953 RepID=A0A4Z0WL53_9GAMM|nr:chemotaxis protein CheW [Natronospirillum operosum]
MNQSRQRDTRVLPPPPKHALNSYLAVLLEDATAQDEDTATLTDLADGDSAAEPAAAPVAEPEPEVDLAPEPEPEPEVDLAPEPEPEPEPEVDLMPEPEPAVEPAPEPEPAPQEPPPGADTVDSSAALTAAQLAEAGEVLAWQSNGRPAWAEQRFDCLLFKVDGLALAVPMVLLGTIQPIARELTPLFGQPDWFLGLLPLGEGRNIRVIETARLVMPERYRPGASDGLKYAVGIHGCDWALACHEVVGSITLNPDEVKWRSERTRRPWLAGTVVDHMCALIDLEAFEKVLLSDKKKG